MPPTAFGKVTRIYANKFGAFIRIDTDGPKPLEEYFKLRLDHPNYNALYSLALAAAANRWPLTIRIEGPASSKVDPTREGIVSWLVVDWKAGESVVD